MTVEAFAAERPRVLERIFNLMKDIAPQSVQDNPDISFLEAGVDSMKQILLVTRLEDEFQIEFKTEHLAPEFLGSPTTVASLLLKDYRVVQAEERSP